MFPDDSKKNKVVPAIVDYNNWRCLNIIDLHNKNDVARLDIAREMPTLSVRRGHVSAGSTALPVSRMENTRH